MFEPTATGWRATDDQIEFWQARDTCSACGALCSPIATHDHMWFYRCLCNCGGLSPNLSPWPPVDWTRPVPVRLRVDDDGVKLHLKGNHQCRLCGRWLEGEWANADEAARAELQRQMDNGRCDPGQCRERG